MLRQKIKDGSALKKMAQFVEAQGGDTAAVYDPSLLPKAALIEPVTAQEEGYISHIECDEIGVCSLMLGGGRETKESVIDLSVGLLLQKKVGDYVKKGDVLAYLHANDREKANAAAKRFLNAYHISSCQPELKPFIRDIIE